MTITLELLPGKSVDMHEATGRDHLVALSYQIRLGMTEYDDLEATAAFTDRWSFLMAQTEKLDGFEFMLPCAQSTPAELLTCFRAWLALPHDLFKAWYQAPDRIETVTTAPELRPPGKVDKATRDDPLPESAATSSEPSTTES